MSSLIFYLLVFSVLMADVGIVGAYFAQRRLLRIIGRLWDDTQCLRRSTMTVGNASGFQKGDTVYVTISGTADRKPMRVVNVTNNGKADELELEEV